MKMRSAFVLFALLAGCQSNTTHERFDTVGYRAKLDGTISSAPPAVVGRLKFLDEHGSVSDKSSFLNEHKYMFPWELEAGFRKSAGFIPSTEESCHVHCYSVYCPHMPDATPPDCGDVICVDECQCGQGQAC